MLPPTAKEALKASSRDARTRLTFMLRTLTLTLALLLTALPLALQGGSASTTPCDRICDLNDGWVHVVRAENIIATTHTGAIVVGADPHGDFVFTQDVWVAPSNGGIYRVGLGNAPQGYVWTSLAFGTARGALAHAQAGEAGSAKVFSTGNTPGITRTIVVHADSLHAGATVVYHIPSAVFAAKGMLITVVDGHSTKLVEPSEVYSSVIYKPRYEGGAGDIAPGNGYTGGAGMSRTDHVARDVTACRNSTTVDAAIVNCPESGGFMSLAKDALVPDHDVASPSATDVQLVQAADALDDAPTPVAGLLL